ncbi:Piso0_004973 [Millerozyma farinosa CBS 7064]|uniref:Piso0_004973 protein n=1 Tax=Pichia sorbitophila (strain ATCC MYA-4447 / BCRC 22081 / CBS 7064 / NBRC 10061 / NRRL Y-12695) TaxID=559304 RepID=G8Y3W4_PICSO|nr:Piso0_004973 [Millerozyma farinosa CBS 7064]
MKQTEPDNFISIGLSIASGEGKVQTEVESLKPSRDLTGAENIIAEEITGRHSGPRSNKIANSNTGYGCDDVAVDTHREPVVARRKNASTQLTESFVDDLKEKELAAADGSADILDLVLQDMEFDEAYSLYQSMQQKQARSAVEQLQRVQMLNSQYCMSIQGSQADSNSPPAGAQNGLDAIVDAFSSYHSQLQNNAGEHIHHNLPSSIDQQASIEKNKPSADSSSNLLATDMANSANGSHGGLKTPRGDDFDQFFSNSESNALSKFLDNLANPLGSFNPISFYPSMPSYSPQHISELDLHTMKPMIPTPPSRHSPQQSMKAGPVGSEAADLDGSRNAKYGAFPHENAIHPLSMDSYNRRANDEVKNELTEAFSHPPSQALGETGFGGAHGVSQVPTPSNSRQSSAYALSPKRGIEDVESFEGSMSPSSTSATTPPSSPPSKRHRRTFHKPLLSLEQKRLNHSCSEQKRRQLCKLAYDRCLRLITNEDDYKESNHEEKKKSKRRHLTKEGLPNLSKYTALSRISNEIMKIQAKNEGLKKRLNMS